MENLPKDWLFVTLSRIEEAQTRHAAEMRHGLQEIRQAQADHALEDSEVQGQLAARLTAVELKQSELARSRHATVSATISGAMVILAETAKYLLGRFR